MGNFYFGLPNSWGFSPYRPYPVNPFDFQQTNEYFAANGDILPSRFITIDENGGVSQSISGDWALGVSQSNTAAFNTQLAANKGYNVAIYGIGQDCWLRLGGTVSAGDKLKPDDLGQGIKASNSELYSATAYQSGSAGQLIRVKVLRKKPLAPQCGYSEYDYEYSYEYGVPCDT